MSLLDRSIGAVLRLEPHGLLATLSRRLFTSRTAWRRRRYRRQVHRRARFIRRIAPDRIRTLGRFVHSPEFGEGHDTFLQVPNFRLTEATHVHLEASRGLAAAATVHSWPERSAWAVSDALIHGPTGLVFHEGALISQSAPLWETAEAVAVASGAHRDVYRLRPDEYIETPVFPLPRGTTYNYYHFAVEYLPQILRSVQRFPDLTVLCARVWPHVSEFLELAGIPYRKAPYLVRAGTVIVAEPAQGGWTHPADAGLLRGFAASLGLDAAPANSGVFLGRSGTSRELAEENRLERILELEGFTVVPGHPNPSVREQIRTFLDCRQIVAVHGAAMANMLWAQRPLRMLELIPESWGDADMYAHLAGVRGDDFSRVVLPSRPHLYGAASDAIPAVRSWLRAFIDH